MAKSDENLSIKILIENLRNGDISSRDILFERLKFYAKRIAMKYYGLPIVSDEDLLSASYEGLLIALERISKASINTNYHTILIGSVTTYVENEIFKNMRITPRSLNKPIILDFLIKLRDLSLKLGRMPEIDEIEDLLCSLNIPVYYLNEILPHTNRQSELYVNTEEKIIFNILYKELEEKLQSMHFTIRELEVFYKLFLTENRTINSVAIELGVTPARIRELRKTVREKLKKVNSSLIKDIKDTLNEIDRNTLSHKKELR